MDGQDQERPYWRRDEDEQESAGEVERYQRQHRSFADKVERVLLQLVVLGLVALVLVQSLQLNRFNNWVLALEGVPVGEVTEWTRTMERSKATTVGGSLASELTVTLASVSRPAAPEVKLLADGRTVGNFAKGELTVTVRPGQELVLDGTGIRQDLTFRVVRTSGLQSPALGRNITVRGDRQSLGVAVPAQR